MINWTTVRYWQVLLSKLNSKKRKQMRKTNDDVIGSVIKRSRDSTMGTTSGKTDTTSGQTSTMLGQTNRQTSTTSG